METKIVRSFEEIINENKELTNYLIRLIRDIFKSSIITSDVEIYKILYPDETLIIIIKKENYIKVYGIHDKKVINLFKEIESLTKEDEYKLFLIYEDVLREYYGLLERLKEKVSYLVIKSEKYLFNKIMIIKVLRDLNKIRRNINEIKECINLSLENSDLKFTLIGDIQQLLEEIRFTRYEIYITIQMKENEIANRMNKLIEDLTLISIIFLPANLIASIFGINIKFPGIDQKNPLYFILVMIIIFISSLFTFLYLKWRKKKYYS